MKRIGLLGGMSWESSALYYRLINELVRDRLGGPHSADCVLASVDFAVIEQCQAQGEWQRAGRLLAVEAAALEAAGAACIVLCTNTMHKVADHISAATTIPLLHLVDATAAAIRSAGLHQVALLGTRFTMEEPFYSERMRGFGVRTLTPNPQERRVVDRVIYDELVLGEIRAASRTQYQQIIERLAGAGAEGVILGCTEIELLIGSDDAPVPVFPSTTIHARAAVDFALA